MDCELEILWAGGFSVLGIFIISNYHKLESSCALLLHTLDSTIRTIRAGLFDQVSKIQQSKRPAGDINPCHTIILIDNGP